MNSLIEAQPTLIRRLTDSTLFYFGTRSIDLNLLPGKAKFEIVHSPIASYGWEYVRYQWFAEKNGLSVIERRSLEPDEVAYFERLLVVSNLDTMTTHVFDNASV